MSKNAPPAPDNSKKSAHQAEKREMRQRMRDKIQEQIEVAQKEHQREMLRRRIELARQGLSHYQQNRPREAVQSFLLYLRILEDWKGVPEGGLSPSNFDIKADAAELLLISGVYWDLVKLYDKMKTTGREKDFQYYMGQYIKFSRGLAHQSLSAETMRKYISMGKPQHKENFKNAYKMLAQSKCFIATSLLDVCQEDTILRLRWYRDEVLEKRASGRALVRAYYRTAPHVARKLDRLPDSMRRKLGAGLDWFADRLVENRSDPAGTERQLAVREIDPKG